MGTIGRLKKVEGQLIKDLRETTLSFRRLGKKYGVSGQAIFDFFERKRINRPKRDHWEKCLICQALIRRAKEPRSDFVSTHTIKKELGLGKRELTYHLKILRIKGLVSPKFGRLRSERLESAYQIYFERGLPVWTIGKQLGIKNFHAVIKKHKASGWNVPDRLWKR